MADQAPSRCRPFPESATVVCTSKDAGIAAIEFALVAPLFLMIVCGIIVYGTYFASWIAVTEIASESARASIAGLSNGEASALAQAQFKAGIAASMLIPANAAVTVTSTTVGQTAVTVSYDFSRYGFNLISLLPIPSTKPSIKVIVSTGSP